MKKIDKEEVYKKFYETIKDEYPYSFEKIKSLCESPFRFVANKMKEIFISFDFRYIGKLTIPVGRARNLKKLTAKNLEEGKITQEQADKYNTVLDYVINKHEKEKKK